MSRTKTKTKPADPAKRARTVIWVLLGALVAAGAIWYAVFTLNKPAPVAVEPVADAQLVREDSHRVT
ncbi:disulfide bond formation protein DsbA, partial [Pseudarthrobacter sp. R1]|nr:disulfide bond formation protein DsbA [Pseudarthrobacter sp. R1]